MEQAAARADAERQSFAAVAAELDRLYRCLARRRASPAATATRSPAARGSRSTCTCTRSHSHDCSIPVDELLDHAESIGLGAIAVTDHNRFGGAQEAVELARNRG